MVRDVLKATLASNRWIIGVAWMCAAPACGGSAPRPVGAQAVAPAIGRLPSGPEAPTHGLPIPGLSVDWTPPMVTAGNVQAFAAALSRFETARVVVGPSLGGDAWRGQAVELVRVLVPDLVVEPAPAAALTSLIASPAELPLQRVPQLDGAGPLYTAEPITIESAGLDTLGASGGAVLALDDAVVSADAWRALPAHAVGDCGPVLSALGAGQEQSLAYLEGFLEHADAVLSRVFRGALEVHVPRMLQELEPYRSPVAAAPESALDRRQSECGHAYWQYLQPLVQCHQSGTTCESAPRLVAVEGAKIAVPRASGSIDPSCSSLVGRDYVADVRMMALEAAQVVQAELDPRWVTLVDRLGVMTQLHAALEDVCVPRRRRFAEDDIIQARQRLVRIGLALASDELEEPAGRWSNTPEVFHVPGLGPMVQLASYDAGQGSRAWSVVHDSTALRQFVLSRALCRSGYKPLPLAALVVDVQARKPAFFGYFYEEELFCGELPPLLPVAD